MTRRPGGGQMIILLSVMTAVSLTACRGKLHQARNPNVSVFEELAHADLTPAPPEGETGRAPTEARWQHASYQQYPGNDRVLAGARDARRAGPRRHGRPGVITRDDGFELNFSDAPLPELTKVILKDTLGIPYVYDARVQGKVTLSTGRPLSRDELLTALESVLQMNRGALVKEETGFRIISESAIKNGGAMAVDYVEEASRIGPGYGITVFPLRYVSSETILRVLTAFVAKSGALRADVARNLLLVRGTGQERRSLLGVAAQFDADWIKGQSVGIYPLRHASPGEVILELEQIFRTDAEGPGKNLVRFQPMGRLRAVLVLATRAELLRQVETWVRRLDRTNEAEIRTFVYHVENGKAKDLAKLLNEVFTGQSSVSDGSADEVAPDSEAVRIDDGLAGDTDRDGTTDTIDVAETDTSSTTPSTSSGSAATRGEIRIVADVVKNNLVIQASGHVYRKMKPVLRDLDRAPAQVIINATLAEVTLNDNLRYGVQVFLRDTDNQRLGGFTNGSVLEIAPELPGLSFLVGLRATPKVVLDALAAETSVRVISSPSVVVLDNQPATLQVGDEVPIATRSSRSVTNPEAPIVNDIEFRNTGVILKVLPRISKNGLVTMEIEQEISNVANAAAVGAAGSLTPTISQRRIASTIAVQSGQMVVLGGLISERKDHTKNRVPIWEKVPFFGQFPGRTNNETSRTELVVFLRPQIIHNAAEAGLIAEELRSRLWALIPKRRRKYERWPKRGWSTRLHEEPGAPPIIDPEPIPVDPHVGLKDAPAARVSGVSFDIGD